MMTHVVFAEIKKGPDTKIIKNKMDAGFYFNYIFNSADIPVSTTGFGIPVLKYYLETAQEETNKFFLNGDLGYNMSKTIHDGDVLEGEDRYASVMYFDLDPQFRFYVTDEMMAKFRGSKKEEPKDDKWNDWVDTDTETKTASKIKWFFAFGLPLLYENVTPQNESLDAEAHSAVDFTVNFGIDNKQVDIKKLSPWAKFQKGYFVYGLFEYRLSESYGDESPEKLPMFFGASGDYAYELDNWVSNATARGFMSIKYQLAAEAIEIFPWEYTMGYQGNYLDLTFGVEYAQDFTDKLNLVASVSGTTWQLGDDPEGDSINSMKFDATLNYYSIPELCAFAGFGFETHLKDEDSTPDYRVTLGAAYTLDFIKLKQKMTQKKLETPKNADEEEETFDDEEW